MNPPSVDIADMLSSESAIGVAIGLNMFIGKEPATPIECVTIFDTPGRPPELSLRGNLDPGYYYPSIQIRVRNSNYLEGWQLVNTIKEFLHGLNNEVKGGATYLFIKCSQEPFLLDWDEKGRARFVANFDLQRTI